MNSHTGHEGHSDQHKKMENHHDHNNGDHVSHEHTGHSHQHEKPENHHDNNGDHGSHEHAEHSHHDHHSHMVADFKKRFWISLVITIPVLFLSPMIRNFFGFGGAAFSGSSYVLFILSTGIFFCGGYPFLKGLFDELKSKLPGMMTLIALAISVAYFYSSAVIFGLTGRLFYWELATLIDVMLLGHWIEMRSIMGASRALEELAKLMPKNAHKILDNGNTEDVTLDKIISGDKVLIKPGEKIPADGEIIEGETYVNEAMVTGESKPVSKKTGDEVIGGSINGEGSLKVEVKKTGSESFLSQVIDMVKSAQASKSKTQNLANRAALWLTITAIASGVITMFVWLLFAGKDFNFALTRTVTVMVITCPHALGLAIPLVVAVSTALSAKKGLLIKNRNGFEKARKLQAVIFDKTGTLTKGEFGVTDIIAFDGEYTNGNLIKYAASIETNSEHPIARGIVQNAGDTFSVKNFNSIPGKGAEGNVNGKDVKVVSPGYLDENEIKITANGSNSGSENNIKEKLDKIAGEGKTVVFVIIDNKLIGAIALADIIREESKEAVAKLKQLGIKTMMLTGDNEKVAKWVADELGLDDYFAQVLPANKADKIKEVQAGGTVVAMTGDGVNDAPALAQADVGIAIGAGTDVAAETADIVLVKSDPRDVVSMIKFSKATYGKMIQNLIWATGYNVIAIPLAAGVLYSAGILLNPAVGAVLMSLSTVIVSINARLLRI